MKSRTNKPEVLNTLATTPRKSNPELQIFAPIPKNVFQQSGSPAALSRTASVLYFPKQDKSEEQPQQPSNWKRTALAEPLHQNDEVL